MQTMTTLRFFVAIAMLSAITSMGMAQQVPAPCAQPSPPKATFTPAASPPDQWIGKGKRKATTLIELTVNKKGKVRDPRVIESGGHDADESALSAVRNWKFTPSKCGKEPIEARIRVSITTELR